MTREPGGVGPSRPRRRARRVRHYAREPCHGIVHIKNHELLVALYQSFHGAARAAVGDAAKDHELPLVQQRGVAPPRRERALDRQLAPLRVLRVQEPRVAKVDERGLAVRRAVVRAAASYY